VNFRQALTTFVLLSLQSSR